MHKNFQSRMCHLSSERKSAIGHRMSIQKMQFRCTPRGTTYMDQLDKNLLYQNPLLPKRNQHELHL